MRKTKEIGAISSDESARGVITGTLVREFGSDEPIDSVTIDLMAVAALAQGSSHKAKYGCDAKILLGETWYAIRAHDFGALRQAWLELRAQRWKSMVISAHIPHIY